VYINNNVLEEGHAHAEIFFDTLEEFAAPSNHFHGRSSSLEGFSSSEGKDSDTNFGIEEEDIEDTFVWPEELLHEPVEERTKKRARRRSEKGRSAYCNDGQAACEEGDDEKEMGFFPPALGPPYDLVRARSPGWLGAGLTCRVPAHSW
jgi:hypothetical protein